MRLVRFLEADGRTRYGVYREAAVHPISGPPFGEVEESGESLAVDRVTLLAPCAPSKIVAVGLNYSDHAAELGMEIPEEPVIFLKAPNTVLPPGGSVIYPEQSEKVDYEVELAVVIGGRASAVAENDALSCVLGYTIGLDMTARDLQEADVQWTRAKNFDTFCPLGPWIETELVPDDLEIELTLNGEVRQTSRTSRMIFGVPRLVSFISNYMTLLPGDVIMTGTPPGVGEVKPGDGIEGRIERIGTLTCTVA